VERVYEDLMTTCGGYVWWGCSYWFYEVELSGFEKRGVHAGQVREHLEQGPSQNWNSPHGVFFN